MDLKMMAPTVEALTDDIARWAAESATGVVFEWENLFPYPGLDDATPDDAALSAACCAPFAGPQAAEVAEEIDSLAPPLAPISRTSPLTFDIDVRSQRMVGFETRWPALRDELAAMDDGAPEAQAHAEAVADFMEGRYLDADVAITREDRYESLARFVDALA